MRAGIDDGAVTACGDAIHFSDFARRGEQVAQDLLVFRFGVIYGLDVLIGHNQHVSWRNGMDIAESRHPFILVNDVGLRFTGSDFAENTGWVHCMP
jgi:hypothetical protein